MTQHSIFKHITSSILLFAAGVFVLAVVIASIHTPKASAAPVVGFNPGKIIDDIVFTRYNSMPVSQIQTFLNSKVPNCDTWGTKPSEFGGGTRAQWGTSRGTPPPYICLKNYSEGGKTAAQIIYDTALEFKINPQVLIVLLQKEQGLVTDEWPLPVQYRTATGYGCPDTAPCDSQYYGLANQLRWSGRMFRAILDNSPTWYTPYILGNNFIRWSPNAACDGSTVNIENRSTQALYNYTPYRPNQAALNAGYGLGDSCSAYGNRNFYLYFSDWFGTVRSNDTMNAHPDGTLINMGGAVFLIYAGGLHHLVNPSVFESQSYRWGDIKIPTTGDKSLPFSWPIDNIQPGTLFSDDKGVYISVYQDGQWKKQMMSYQTFQALNYNWGQVRKFPSYELPALTVDGYLNTDTHPEGTLINTPQGVFLIEGGTKRYVSPWVFESQRWNWGDIVNQSVGDQALPRGADMLLKRGTVITDRNNLYVVEVPPTGSEIKRPIGPWECFDAVMRYRLSEAVYIPTDVLPAATGPLISC